MNPVRWASGKHRATHVWPQPQCVWPCTAGRCAHDCTGGGPAPPPMPRRDTADSLYDFFYSVRFNRAQGAANMLLEAYHWLRAHHPYWWARPHPSGRPAGSMLIPVAAQSPAGARIGETATCRSLEPGCRPRPDPGPAARTCAQGPARRARPHLAGHTRRGVLLRARRHPAQRHPQPLGPHGRQPHLQLGWAPACVAMRLLGCLLRCLPADGFFAMHERCRLPSPLCAQQSLPAAPLPSPSARPTSRPCRLPR